MLCWKLLEINTRFSNYLMETERGLDLMVVLIFYANENKLDPCKLIMCKLPSLFINKN